MLYFFHISRDASDEKLESFKKGIDSAVGIGYGGQRSGFYCWTNEEQANKLFAQWAIGADAAWAKEKFGIDITLKDGNALKLKIPVEENSVKYPNYQLDNEQHANKNRGRDRSIWLDFWEAQKDLFKKENQFQIGDIPCRGMEWDEQAHCPVMIIQKENSLEKISVNSTRAEDSLRTQAINDYLADKYLSYRENYDKLLMAVALNEQEIQIGNKILHPQNIALKYCGDERLTDMEISKLHSNFGADEKIDACKTVRYGEHSVQYTEEVLFSSRQQDFNLNKLNDIRKKLPDSTPTSKPETIDELRGIGIERISEPVRKTTLDAKTI